MKQITLIALILIFISCKKIPIVDEPLYSAESSNNLPKEWDGKLTSVEYVLANEWPLTYAYWNDEGNCGTWLVYLNGHQIQVQNPTKQQYNSYPQGTKLKGQFLYELLKERKYWP